MKALQTYPWKTPFADVKVLRKWTQKKYSFQWRIYWRGPKGPGPPLFLDQTEAPRAEKKFFWDRASPVSQGLDDRAPALSECLDSPLHLRIDLDLICSFLNLIIDCYLYHLLHRHRHRHHNHYYTDDLVIRRQKYSNIRLKKWQTRWDLIVNPLSFFPPFSNIKTRY